MAALSETETSSRGGGAKGNQIYWREWECIFSDCGFKTSRISMLRHHMAFCHRPSSVCPICGKEFMHIETHCRNEAQRDWRHMAYFSLAISRWSKSRNLEKAKFYKCIALTFCRAPARKVGRFVC